MTKLIKGINDLKSVNPSLAKEWHPTLNGDLSLEMFTAGSSKKVHWLCENGHVWQATIASRNAGSGCPICARESNRAKIKKALIEKRGSLYDGNSVITKEWHPFKNNGLSPKEVSTNSHDVVWWKCSICDYEWKAWQMYSCPTE